MPTLLASSLQTMYFFEWLLLFVFARHWTIGFELHFITRHLQFGFAPIYHRAFVFANVEASSYVGLNDTYGLVIPVSGLRPRAEGRWDSPFAWVAIAL